LPYQQGHGHSPKVSQTQKTALSPVATHRLTRTLTLSVVGHITTAPILRPFFPTQSILIKPSRFHTSLSPNPFERCCGARSHRHEHGGDTEEAAPSSRSDMICRVRACACRYLALHASTARMYSLSTCSYDNFTCIPSYASPRCTFRASRVYSRTRLCRGLRSSASLMRAKQKGLMVCNIARRAPSCRSRRSRYPPNVLPALARFKLS
jgi:hypothetical protein